MSKVKKSSSSSSKRTANETIAAVQASAMDPEAGADAEENQDPMDFEEDTSAPRNDEFAFLSSSKDGGARAAPSDPAEQMALDDTPVVSSLDTDRTPKREASSLKKYKSLAEVMAYLTSDDVDTVLTGACIGFRSVI